MVKAGLLDFDLGYSTQCTCDCDDKVGVIPGNVLVKPMFAMSKKRIQNSTKTALVSETGIEKYHSSNASLAQAIDGLKGNPLQGNLILMSKVLHNLLKNPFACDCKCHIGNKSWDKSYQRN